MKQIIHFILIFILLQSTLIQAQDQIKAVSKKEYMVYIEAAAEDAWTNLEESRKRWRENTHYFIRS